MQRDNIPKKLQGPVTARLKIMSGMDIAEKRLPQDGRIKMAVDEKPIDFRVSAPLTSRGITDRTAYLLPDNVKIGIQSMGLEE